ncbi:hypothetical protein CDL15_Pgr009582 [Punica granatum]|uniref:Uncharacterized protein n=1 Tax=Punica granatum TaxID=22663 RepID=A0A218WST7_PUNGR|nr:hypothetical protein CDL15_Pgr009582 [Punica granatum]
MKYSSKHSIFNALLSTCCLSVLCIADDFDFLYFVQQISDLISSLEKSWPTLSCPSKNGLKFWAHEWVKHGTCSESELDQHDYFEAGLKLKEKMDLLQALNNAGIEPNDKFYSLESIKEAIKETVSHEPGIECNVDPSGNKQLSEGLALSQDFDFFYFTQQDVAVTRSRAAVTQPLESRLQISGFMVFGPITTVDLILLTVISTAPSIFQRCTPHFQITLN